MEKMKLLTSSQWTMVVVVVTLLTAVEGAGKKNCSVSRCGDGGPEIHFPFWLKQNNTAPADDCAYLPEFQLFCGPGRGQYQSHKDSTLVKFQHIVNTSIKGLDLAFKYEAIVSYIDYTNRALLMHIPLLVDIVPIFSSISSHLPFKPNTFNDISVCYQTLDTRNTIYELFNLDPFRSCYYGYSRVDHYYTFFNCSSSSPVIEHNGNIIINSLSTKDFKVYAYSSSYPAIYMLDRIRSCTKMYDISTRLKQSSQSCACGSQFYSENILSWSQNVGGGKCEAARESCNIYDDDSNSYTDFPYSQPSTRGSGRAIAKLLVAVLLPCIFLVVLGLIFRYNFVRLNKQREEDELKIKMFMENYKALKPTRYSYSDIKKITNTFKHKLGQGGYGSVFKGQISADIPVAVKVLHIDSKANGDDFINEVGTIGKIHHVNVVRLLGYCADGCNRALVYEFQPNHSLEKFVYRREKPQNFIGWKKMQKIARGIAKGMEYL
nr:PREDICTED: rust resistance kinase Lr10-like [Daucus carota subsp. sativus]